MLEYCSDICTIDNQLFQRIRGKSYKDNCFVSLDDLRYVTVLHYGFDGQIYKGELIVNKIIAEKITCIFHELYDAEYPIEKICLVDEYDADDNASMADNNSSSFNYRTIDGMTKLSNHSLGLAIDINPLYNPYVRTLNGAYSVLPREGKPYVDRTQNCPYIIQKGDICYNTFLKYGFSWGGEWVDSKDYQHFEYV